MSWHILYILARNENVRQKEIRHLTKLAMIKGTRTLEGEGTGNIKIKNIICPLNNKYL